MKTFCLFILCMCMSSIAVAQKKSTKDIAVVKPESLTKKQKSEQRKIHILEYDYRQASGEKVILDQAIKQGNYVRLRIDNINLLSNDVKFKIGTRNYNTEASTGIAAVLGIQKNNEESEEKDEDALLKTGGATIKMKVTAQKSSSTPIATEMNTLVSSCDKLLDLSNKLLELKAKRLELLRLSKSNLSYNKLKTEVESLYPTVPSIGSMKNDITQYLKAYERAKAAYEEAESAALSKEIAFSVSAKMIIQEKQGEVSFEKIMMQREAMKVAKEEIQEAKEDIKEGYETLEGEDIYSFANDIKTLYEQLLNEENFRAISNAGKMNGDYLIFTVEVSPKEGIKKPTDPLYIEVPGKGGWKTDFSLGPALSFGKGSRDDKYYLEAFLEDSSFLRLKTNENVLRPGIASMMHMYKRTPKDTQVGFAFGVGANFKSIEDADLSYYLGLSVIFGKIQRVNFTAGVSFLKVDRFTEEYKLDNKYPTDVIAAATKTDKVIRGSFFFSISYSLAKKKDSQ